jgi:hypothetical protein
MVSVTFIRYCGLVVLLAAIAGCGALPRPFQPSSGAAVNPLIEQGVPPDIAVNQVQGTTVPMGKLLTQSVVSELANYDIVSYADDRGTSSFVLDGDVIGSPVSDSGPNENKATGRRIHWVISNREGVIAREYDVAITGPAFDWDYGSPRIIKEVGEATALEVANLLIGRTARSHKDTQNRSGVWVRPISDAPGDGNFSLTRAIAFTLGDHGMKVVKSQAMAEHYLKGSVRLGPAESGNQKIEVTWVVTDTNDKEIGRARQRNTVPVGTFDGRWGQTAVMISMAAVSGIKNIITAKATQSLNQGKQPFRLVFPETTKDGKLVIPPPSLEPN